jgi:hypothetical protein
VHAELLRRHKPALRYDSQEAYFADSAAEWTDNPGNVLSRRDGTVLARQPELTLDLLGADRYGDGAPVEPGDRIGDLQRDYREQYGQLRGSDRARYANRVYGRAVEGSDGRLWLQYWLWYFYNDYTLAFDVGLHEGDWEMVQLRIAGDRPDLAVYAQHAFAEEAAWGDVRHPDGSPDTPLVYPGRGSHASYFEPGLHDTEVWYDLADGRRPAPELRLELLDDLAWSRWPGTWGDSDDSPTAPCTHSQWRDPSALRRKARPHVVRDPRDPPEVEAFGHRGRLRLRFDLSRHGGAPPFALVITINSRDEPEVAPHAHTFALGDERRGQRDTDIEVDPRKHYDVNVSTTDGAGVPSAARLVLIEPEPGGFDPRAILRALGRLFALVRGFFARR